MVKHEILSDKTSVEPLASQKSPWAGLFHDLLNGETVYIQGSIEELRGIRRKVLSACNFRKRKYPYFTLTIHTKLGVINEKTALIISGELGDGKVEKRY